MHNIARLALVVLAFFVIAIGAMAAQETDWKKGKLQHLSKLIGTYQIEAILSDPYVNRKLKAYLGPRYPHLVRNLKVRGPIDMSGGVLVVSGGQAHKTNKEAAFITVSPYDGEINVAIYSQGKIFLFSQKERYEYLPGDLRFWIYRMNKKEISIFSTPPPNLFWQRNQ